jgi:Ca-activated chloride channel homolog
MGLKRFIQAGFWVPILSLAAMAQKENTLIRIGNRYYRQNQIDLSLKQYQKAVEKEPENPAANYNLGNAQYRKNDFGAAVKSYDASIQNSPDKPVQEKGQYNKGVALVRDQKLEESIGAWENALKLDPGDTEARENLQKALLEQKKNQPKDQKKDQDQQNKKQPNQKNDRQQPKEPQSKLSKQQVQQLLNALQQKEKEVEEKMNQNKPRSLKQPEKDW